VAYSKTNDFDVENFIQSMTAMAELVADGVHYTVPRKTLMNKCQLFEQHPDLLVRYTVKTRVEPDVFRLLVREIEDGDILITSSNHWALSQLGEELRFTDLRDKIAEFSKTGAPCDECDDDMNSRLCALEEGSFHEEMERERLTTEVESLHNCVSDLKDEISKLSSALENSEREIRELREMMRSNQDQATKAKRTTDTKIKSLSASIERLKAGLAAEPGSFPFRRERYVDCLARQVIPPCSHFRAQPPHECPGLDVDFDVAPVPDNASESEGPFELTFDYPVRPVFMEVEKCEGTFLWVYIDGNRRRGLKYLPVANEDPHRKSFCLLGWPYPFLSLKIQCCTSVDQELLVPVSYLRMGFIANPPATYI
jgi:hypothetical protein